MELKRGDAYMAADTDTEDDAQDDSAEEFGPFFDQDDGRENAASGANP